MRQNKINSLNPNISWQYDIHLKNALNLRQ